MKVTNPVITITINPQDAAQMGVIAEALKKLLESVQPPEEAPTREELDQALAHADAIRAEKLQAEAARAKADPEEAPAAPKKPRASRAASTPAAAAPEPTAPATTATESPSKPITLEEVRAKLAPISQAGKAAAVRDLIKRVGGSDKLSEVPAEKYAALMAEAEAL